MTESQPREFNGQFGTKPAAEVEIDLSPPLQGSFLFPPHFENAEQVIEFFNRVDIADNILVKISSGYSTYYAATGSVEADDTSDGWWDEGEKPFRERNGGDTSDRARGLYITELEKSWRERPSFLAGADARTAARVIGMRRAMVPLSRSEQDIVESHLVQSSRGMVSVREFNRDMGLRLIAGVVMNPVNYDTDAKIRELQVELARTRDQLDDDLKETRRHVDNSLGQTGSAIIDAISINR